MSMIEWTHAAETEGPAPPLPASNPIASSNPEPYPNHVSTRARRDGNPRTGTFHPNLAPLDIVPSIGRPEFAACFGSALTGTLPAETCGFTQARDVTIDPAGVLNGNSATLEVAIDSRLGH